MRETLLCHDNVALRSRAACMNKCRCMGVLNVRQSAALVGACCGSKKHAWICGGGAIESGC